MNETSLTALFITLAGLILLSAFFSSSETGMMSLNRYRLKHMAKTGHKGAKRAHRLLQRTDQLIGVILIGNNFANIFASSIATVIAIRIWGDAGIAIATILLTIVILIFAEVTPKTLAALFPEKIAFPASYVLGPLLKLLYPVVWAVNLFTGAILTETIFSWPGVGKWLIEAIGRRDYPVLQGGVLLVGAMVMGVSLLVDITYGIINPRIRHQR